MGLEYANIFQAVPGNGSTCTCSTDFFGFSSGEREVRAFYGDAAYDFLVAEGKRRNQQEKTRRDLIRRGDFIDDVACQLLPERE